MPRTKTRYSLYDADNAIAGYEPFRTATRREEGMWGDLGPAVMFGYMPDNPFWRGLLGLADYVLYSFATPIAFAVSDYNPLPSKYAEYRGARGLIWLRYSRTTARHQQVVSNAWLLNERSVNGYDMSEAPKVTPTGNPRSPFGPPGASLPPSP